MQNCRMILLCTNLHKLINPIRSRCLNIRIPAPNTDTIATIIADISRSESTNPLLQPALTPELCHSIASHCDRNLRLAIIQLQASKFTKNSEGMLAPYKREIREISQLIFKEQSPAQLKRIRDKFYDLLVNCIDGQTILKELLNAILREPGQRQEAVKQIIHHAAEHERTLMCGSKAIYHL